MPSSSYFKIILLLVLLAAPVAFAYSEEVEEEPMAPVDPPVDPPPVDAPVDEPVTIPVPVPVVPVPVPVAPEPEPESAPPVDEPVEVPVPIAPEPVPEAPVPVPVPVAPPVMVDYDVLPVGHCWEIADPNVSTQALTLYFGYVSSENGTVEIEAGADNNVTGTANVVNAPTQFKPGRHSFSLVVSATVGEVVVWELAAGTATINTGLAEHSCARSDGPLVVTLTYDAAIPNPQSTLTSPLANVISDITGFDENDFSLTINTNPTKRDPFTVNAAFNPTATGPSQASAVALLVNTPPANLAAGGYTPLDVSSQDTSLDIAAVPTPITPPTPTGLSDGGIAGIVIGAVAGALILAIVIYIIVSNMTGAKRSTTAASASAAASSRASTARAANPVVDDSSEEDSEEEDSEEEESEEEEETSEEESEEESQEESSEEDSEQESSEEESEEESSEAESS